MKAFRPGRRGECSTSPSADIVMSQFEIDMARLLERLGSEFSNIELYSKESSYGFQALIKARRNNAGPSDLGRESVLTS